MKLSEEILKEHSKPHALKIAAYASSSPEKFKELMKCFMSDEYRLAQRAAWSVSWAAKKKPEMVKPYIRTLVAALEKKGVHDAVIRNSLRVLEEVEIPKAFHGRVMNTCFGFVENPNAAVAFKAFSLAILGKLMKFYPEIKQELKLVIEDNWDNETPAFRSRGRRILKSLNTTSSP
jgi:hypothetical protein